MRRLRAAGLDVVLLALLGSSAMVILMVCLLGLLGLSKTWDGDVLGQLLLLRGGIAQTMTREAGSHTLPPVNWQNPGRTHASLRTD
jgi:hypothetical protein